MYKTFFTLLFLCACLSVTAQQEKIYYDEHWQETTKKKADFYRLYTLEDSIFKIEDHYIDGPLYMTGYRTTIASNSCNYRTGPIVFYDEAGHKLREGHYNKGLRTGTWKFYYKGSDALRDEHYYSADTAKHMDYSLTFDSATHRLKYKTVYVDSEKTRHWEYIGNDSVYSESSHKSHGDTNTTVTRYKDHTVTRIEIAKGKDSPIVTCYNEKGAVIPCDTTKNTIVYVEQMPKAGFSVPAYLGQNLHYPKEAIESSTEGKVIVKFVVDEDGAVSETRVVKGIGQGCDEEAIRVVSEMPYWQPGTQNNVPLRVYFTIPLTFKLQ